MQKLKYIAIMILTLFILISCQNSKNKQKLGDVLNLKEDDIKQIIVETTLTKEKSDVILGKNEYKEFLDKILSYDILEKENDNLKGWYYFIKIKLDSDEYILLSILDNIFYLNDREYISNNFKKDDLLYLFENK